MCSLILFVLSIAIQSEAPHPYPAFSIPSGGQDKHQECPRSRLKEVVCCENELKVRADEEVIIHRKKNMLCRACAEKYFDEHVVKALSAKDQCDCAKCSDAIKQIRTGVARAVKSRACVRSYWMNPDCAKCKDLKSLKKGKCCGGKGEPMQEFSDAAPLVDVCEACRRNALLNRKIDHDESIHNVWNCPECKEEFKQKRTHCSRAADPAGTVWNPPSETVLSKKPERILKSVCMKSGEFPHKRE